MVSRSSTPISPETAKQCETVDSFFYARIDTKLIQPSRSWIMISGFGALQSGSSLTDSNGGRKSMVPSK